jgi:hypothetical protein
MRKQWMFSFGAAFALVVNLTFVSPVVAVEPYDLLIVTVDRFVPEANRLAAWKQQLGFRTKVISQSVWADPAHSDIRSKLGALAWKPYSTINDNTVRQAIAPFISSNGIKYLLLIGTPNDILPIVIDNAYGQTNDYSNWRQTDLYYANCSYINDNWLFNISPPEECLSGSYSGADCIKPVPYVEFFLSDYFGDVRYNNGPFSSYSDYLIACLPEIQTVNYYPDVAYGRISVESAAEFSAIVDKIIDFEKNPSTNANYYNKFIVASYQEQGQGNAAISNYIPTAKDVFNWNTTHGKTGTYFFHGYPETDMDGFTYRAIAPSEISAAIQTGAFFLLHRDHGKTSQWVAPGYSTTDIGSLTNADKPFVFNIDCETGTLFPDGFGNQFVNKANGGAIAAVGASGQSLNDLNNLLARALTYTILPGNFSGITDMNLSAITTTQSHRIGDVLNTAKRVMDMSTVRRWLSIAYFERYSLAGDPTVEILTQMPSTITATYGTTFPLGTSSMNITAISCPSGKITLVNSSGALIARQAFIGSSVTLPFSAITTAQTATLTISSYGFKPLIAQITFSTPTGFNFTATPSLIPSNTPVTLSYNIPAAYNGAIVRVIEHRQWNNQVQTNYNQVPLSGATGSHSYGPIWFWTKSYFGTSSGPYAIDLQVNGVVVQSIQISFAY